jgi:RNA polymerase sigma-70 factor (ECF subfamily)
MGFSCSESGCCQPRALALISRCAAGDDQAWNCVVRSIEARVFWLTYRFTHCREDAEDLTQETFFRAYTNLHQFRKDEATLQSWIMAIARNLVVDHYRQVKTLPTGADLDRVDQLNLAEESGIDPLNAVEQAEVSRLVRNGLWRLPPVLRQAVQLKYIDQMEYHQIAALLNVAEGTVKSRVSRGRARLARIMRARLKNRRGAARERPPAARVG